MQNRHQKVLEANNKIKNDIEIAYIYDLDTGWAEGLNEFGIGIINTALMVGHDEKEKTIVSKTGKKSADGKKIIKALSFKLVNPSLFVLNLDSL
jgi:hypothetical protein